MKNLKEKVNKLETVSKDENVRHLNRSTNKFKKG
jgi:hypothetical protein